MSGIFINYRRDDAPGVAGRLYDRLASHFSRSELFMDVDAMRPGVDFIQQLNDEVSECDVLLTIIGPNWLSIADGKGKRRLESDEDYVRIELAWALERGIPVIPILVAGAEVPTEDDLPANLKPLARRHALELRHSRFAADADAIVLALKNATPHRGRTGLWYRVGAASIILSGVAAMAGIVWIAFPRHATNTKYEVVGSSACFGGAEYPQEWHKAANCVSYGCSFGKQELDDCLTLGAIFGAKEVIHGNPDSERSNECWLQNSCADLRPHDLFTDYRAVEEEP